jgi:hypothetical protein
MTIYDHPTLVFLGQLGNWVIEVARAFHIIRPQAQA